MTTKTTTNLSTTHPKTLSMDDVYHEELEQRYAFNGTLFHIHGESAVTVVISPINKLSTKLFYLNLKLQ